MLKLQLLGSTELRDAGGTSIRSVLAQPKRFALLAYLVLRGGNERRDSLLSLFWPEVDEDRARAALRQAIHQLRRSVGPETIVGLGDDAVGVADGEVECDAVEFTRAVAEGRWEAAVRLYGGDLLPGFALEGVPEFEHWLDATRATLRRDACRAAGECGKAAEARGDLAEAVEWSRRQLALSPTDETVLRRLLAQLRDAGDRAGALQAFEDFRREIDRIYGLEPSLETLAVVAELQSPVPAPEPVAPPTEIALVRRERAGVPAGEVPPAARPIAPAPPAGGLRGLVRRPKTLSSILAAAAMVAAIAVARPYFATGLSADPDRASLAVLPFADISPGGSAEYIGLGMTEELISALGELPSISVKSRTSAYALVGSELRARDIGRRLGVDHVLEGTVQREGDRLRVSIRLIDTRDGSQRWSETYDREVADVLAIRDDIGAKVVEALRGEFAFRRPSPTRDAAAYDHYLRARFLLRGRLMEGQTRPRIEAAIRHLTAATRADSSFARAHAGLGEAYVTLAEFAGPRETLPLARASAERAIAIDPGIAEAHVALGHVLLTYDWDWEAAEREYRRAIQLDEDLPEAHYAYARFLRGARRFDESLAETRHGLAIERRSAGADLGFAFRENERLANAYLFARRYDQAIIHAERALELDPNAVTPRATLALAHQKMGRPEEAVAVLEQSRVDFGDRSPLLWRLGEAYARVGRTEDAREILGILLERRQNEFVPKYQIGLIHLGMGDVGEAVRWFDSALEDRPGWWVTVLNSSPRYEELREDPRFAKLLQKVRAPA